MRRNIKVAITFDDTILPLHYKIAYELHRLAIPATFYVVTHKNPWSTYLKYAKKISDMKHEIASHGAYHLDLTKVSDEKLLFEIGESKKTLEEVAGRDIIGFAYPYGLYNSRVISAVSKFYEYGRTAYLRSVKRMIALTQLRMTDTPSADYVTRLHDQHSRSLEKCSVIGITN